MAEQTKTGGRSGGGRFGGGRRRFGGGAGAGAGAGAGGGRFRRFRRRKICVFCKDPDLEVDYKDVDLLKRYISDRGRMFPRRRSGNCAKHQRRVAEEIKRARFVALLPYTTE